MEPGLLILNSIIFRLEKKGKFLCEYTKWYFDSQIHSILFNQLPALYVVFKKVSRAGGICPREALSEHFV